VKGLLWSRAATIGAHDQNFHTYIKCNMAHNCRVVWQTDILGIVLIVLALWSAGVLLIDDESSLDIDAHIARM